MTLDLNPGLSPSNFCHMCTSETSHGGDSGPALGPHWALALFSLGPLLNLPFPPVCGDPNSTLHC